MDLEEATKLNVPLLGVDRGRDRVSVSLFISFSAPQLTDDDCSGPLSKLPKSMNVTRVNLIVIPWSNGHLWQVGVTTW